jgi:hypothetical protein
MPSAPTPRPPATELVRLAEDGLLAFEVSLFKLKNPVVSEKVMFRQQSVEDWPTTVHF